LERNRHKVFESIDKLTAWSAALHEERASAQGGLFGDSGEDLPPPRLPAASDWLPVERLGQEHQAIGFYLSGHPLDDYRGPLARKNVLTLAELRQKAQGARVAARIAGTIEGKQERKSARGNRFAFVQLSDATGRYEVTVFSDTLEQYRAHLEVGNNVVLAVEAEMEGDQLKLLARSVQPVDVAVADAAAMGLVVMLNDAAGIAPLAETLEKAAEGASRRTRGPVRLRLVDPALPGEVEMALGDEFAVNPQVKGALRHLPGVVEVEDF